MECLQDKIRQDRKALRVKNEFLRSVIAQAKAEERKEQDKQRKIKDAQEEASLRSKGREVIHKAREQAKKKDIHATLASLIETNATILGKQISKKQQRKTLIYTQHAYINFQTFNKLLTFITFQTFNRCLNLYISDSCDNNRQGTKFNSARISHNAVEIAANKDMLVMALENQKRIMNGINFISDGFMANQVTLEDTLPFETNAEIFNFMKKDVDYYRRKTALRQVMRTANQKKCYHLHWLAL